MTKTRIATAGAGMIGQAHLRVAQQSQTCAVSALVDPSPAAEAIAAQAGAALYRSLDELLASERPDGVLLATPNHLHVPQALQCIAAGLPSLLEKPIATAGAEGEQLLRGADRAVVST